jgi:hypothetical protein
VGDELSYASGSLRGSSYSSTSATQLYCGDYDLAILVSSWDTRSVCVSQAERFKAGLCVVTLFTYRDRLGLRDRHDADLLAFAQRCAPEVCEIRGDSLDLENTWSQLLRSMVAHRHRTKRPLHIFVDASACPRYYLLAIVATALSSGLAARVSVTYAEGRYPAKTTNSSEDISFTHGQWKSVAIPTLEGKYSPGLKRFLLVSIGFEGWKTIRAVSRADPDRVSILHGKPGTTTEYADRALQDNADLIQYYRIPPEQILCAPAGDAIAAWKTLSASAIERPEENAYFLCSGTKPHSLGLGLRALCLRSPAVLYNLPEAHHVVEIEPNGKFWRFDIESLTVPA